MSPQPPPRPTPQQEQANRGTYIPDSVKSAMDKQMQRNLPPHLQKYAGAYMQQQVYDPSMNSRAGRPMQNGAPPPTYHPVTHLPRESHYVQYQGDSRPPTEPEPVGDQPPATFNPDQAYDFINEPLQDQNSRSILPSNSSLPMRIAIFGGGLVILLIAFVVIKGFLGGGGSSVALTTVAQDQEAIIHLTDNAQQQTDLSDANKNFSATASLSLSSSQSDLITYMTKNGTKVKSKELGIKISKTTDAQLVSAASAATYNETYKSVMHTKISSYMNDLKLAFQETSGPNGQALLNSQYEQAKLLLIQLDDTKS